MGDIAQDEAIKGLTARLQVALSRFDEVNEHLPDDGERYGMSPLFNVNVTLATIIEFLESLGMDGKAFLISNLEKQITVVEDVLRAAAIEVHEETGRTFPFIMRGQG